MTTPSEPAQPQGFIQNTMEEVNTERSPSLSAGRGFAVSDVARLRRSFPNSPIYNNQQYLDPSYREHQRLNPTMPEGEEPAEWHEFDAPQGAGHFGFSSPQEVDMSFLNSPAVTPEMGEQPPVLGRSRFASSVNGHHVNDSQTRFNGQITVDPNIGIQEPNANSSARSNFYPESWGELSGYNISELKQRLLNNTIKEDDKALAVGYYNYPSNNHANLDYNWSLDGIEDNSLGTADHQSSIDSDLIKDSLQDFMSTPILDNWNESDQNFENTPRHIARSFALKTIKKDLANERVVATPEFIVQEELTESQKNPIKQANLDKSDTQAYYSFDSSDSTSMDFNGYDKNLINDNLGSSQLQSSVPPAQTLGDFLRTPILDAWNSSPNAFNKTGLEDRLMADNENVAAAEGMPFAPAIGPAQPLDLDFSQISNKLIAPFAGEELGFIQSYYDFSEESIAQIDFSSTPDLNAFNDVEGMEITDTNGNNIYSRFMPNPKPPENFDPNKDNQNFIDSDFRPVVLISPINSLNPLDTASAIKERNSIIFNSRFPGA